MSFEDSGDVVFSFRHYPGDIPGFQVHVDAKARTFFFEDQPEKIEALSALRLRLDQRHLERKQLYHQSHGSAAPATLSAQISSLWQKVQLVILLTLSLLFVIGGVWWVLSGEGGIAGCVVVIAALGAMIMYIGGIKEVFGNKK